MLNNRDVDALSLLDDYAKEHHDQQYCVARLGKIWMVALGKDDRSFSSENLHVAIRACIFVDMANRGDVKGETVTVYNLDWFRDK